MRTSIKTSVKFGLSGLILSPVRLIITVLLAAISFGLFGTAISAYRFDEETARRDVLFSDGYNIVGDISWDDYSLYSEKSGGTLMAVGGSSETSFYFQNFVYDYSKYDGTCYNGLPDYVAYAENDFFENAGVSVTGRLPDGENEIVLSSCLANSIVAGGYYDYINYPYDLLTEKPAAEGAKEVTREELVSGNYFITLYLSSGETVNAAVVGVVEDECPIFHGNDVAESEGYHDTIFLSKALFEKVGINYLYGIPGGGYSKNTESKEALYTLVESSENCYFDSTGLDVLSTEINTLENMRKAFLVIGIILAVFAAILIYQFISYSVQGKKGEIAILRALGARKSDVLGIYLMESLLLWLIQSILAGVICTALSSSINVAFTGLVAGLVFLHVDVIIILIVFALNLAVTLLSAIVPIIRTANKSPVEAIRENQE